MARNAEDVTPQDPQLTDNALYLRPRARPAQAKPPSRAESVGAVAAARAGRLPPSGRLRGAARIPTSDTSTTSIPLK